jgi:hypothetical protein
MEHCILRELSTRKFGVELEVSNNFSKKQIGEFLQLYELRNKIPSRSKPRSVRVTSGPKGWAQTKKNTYWHVKYDSTCGPKGKGHDNGWEIASYIASGLHDLTHISRLAGFLNANGVETNTNCGLHIHVEVKDFTRKDISNLLARWMKVENLLIDLCDKSRKKNQYCKSIYSRFSLIKKSCCLPDFFELNLLWDLLQPTSLGIHDNADKKYTLNTVGFKSFELNPNFARPTVELRLPECVLDEVHIKNWTALILNFVQVTKSKEWEIESFEPIQDLNEALLYLGLKDDSAFAILDPTLVHVKFWLLAKIITRSQNAELVAEAKKEFDFATLFR